MGKINEGGTSEPIFPSNLVECFSISQKLVEGFHTEGRSTEIRQKKEPRTKKTKRPKKKEFHMRKNTNRTRKTSRKKEDGQKKPGSY